MTPLLLYHSGNSAISRQPVRWALRLDAGRPVISVDIRCDIPIEGLFPFLKGWPNSETRLRPGGRKGNRDNRATMMRSVRVVQVAMTIVR